MIKLAASLLRGVIATFAGLLIAGGTLTLAADRAGPGRPTLVAVAPSPGTLVVPRVAGQAYVFAKGILQDGGFAWRVAGPVQGFAADTVVGQDPAAGSIVLDTGAPTVTLTLDRNPAYAERGLPQDTSPYRGTAIRLPAGVPQPRPQVAPVAPTRTPAGLRLHGPARKKVAAKNHHPSRAKRA